MSSTASRSAMTMEVIRDDFHDAAKTVPRRLGHGGCWHVLGREGLSALIPYFPDEFSIFGM